MTQTNNLTHSVNQNRRDSVQSIHFKIEQANKNPSGAIINRDAVADKMDAVLSGAEGADICHLTNEGVSKSLRGNNWQPDRLKRIGALPDLWMKV